MVMAKEMDFIKFLNLIHNLMWHANGSIGYMQLGKDFEVPSKGEEKTMAWRPWCNEQGEEESTCIEPMDYLIYEESCFVEES